MLSGGRNADLREELYGHTSNKRKKRRDANNPSFQAAACARLDTESAAFAALEDDAKRHENTHVGHHSLPVRSRLRPCCLRRRKCLIKERKIARS